MENIRTNTPPSTKTSGNIMETLSFWEKNGRYSSDPKKVGVFCTGKFWSTCEVSIMSYIIRVYCFWYGRPTDLWLIELVARGVRDTSPTFTSRFLGILRNNSAQICLVTCAFSKYRRLVASGFVWSNYAVFYLCSFWCWLRRNGLCFEIFVIGCDVFNPIWWRVFSLRWFLVLGINP